MEIAFTNRIKDSLFKKRHNLVDWLGRSSSEEKDECLACEGETCLQPHLEVIETTLDQVEHDQFGVCTVCQGKIEQNLIEMDYTSSVCLECMSRDDRTALENELELSRKLQKAFMGTEIPAVPGMDLAVFSRPAQVLSGDYFDVLPFRSGEYGLVVADAMGHGLSASIVMASLQTAFRTLTLDSHVLEEILSKIHHLYVHNINATIFATVFLGRFDPLTYNFTYCNSGHNPAILFQKQTSAVKWLGPTGPAVGIIEDYRIHSATERLSPGDMVVLYSDGAPDTSNPQGDEFGRQRLAEIVRQNQDLQPRELIDLLKRALNDFSAGQPIGDDTTLVVGKVQAQN